MRLHIIKAITFAWFCILPLALIAFTETALSTKISLTPLALLAGFVIWKARSDPYNP